VWGGAGIGVFGVRDHASGAVASAFGSDAVGAVLRAGALPFGHHGGAVGAVVGRRVGFRGGYAAGHRVGNSRALPDVVTWMRPAGEVKISVPSGSW
jgi:hypothetical protein